ncbi:MAG: hypothetical protein ACFFC7_21495 [Candidatus Hermodarchaeota archaeon]
MSAITVGTISGSPIPDVTPEKEFHYEIARILAKYADKFRLVENYPDNHQLLLSMISSNATDQEDIRNLLKELQQLTALSYVALMNPATKLILITLRG